MATRADQRKFHYVYKITRTDGSGKYYIGMHSTDDLEDGYFGSGMLLWKSIKKHGKEKHSKEILEFLPSREELKSREKALVNEEILDDPLCMNLKLGGEGGGHFQSKEHQRKATIASNQNATKRLALSKAVSESNKHRHASGTLSPPTFVGCKHSQISKDKISASMIGKQHGEQNSQHGTCWITNGIKSIKIKKEQLNEYTQNGYTRGRVLTITNLQI